MLTTLNVKKAGQRIALAALLCGIAVSANSISQVSAQPETAFVETVVFDKSLPASVGETEVRSAVESFIRAMKNADAQTAWMFATEEDQEAFATEEAVYAAFAETFP